MGKTVFLFLQSFQDTGVMLICGLHHYNLSNVHQGSYHYCYNIDIWPTWCETLLR